MFEKKFKVRVRHFAEARYIIEWSNSRFTPRWRSLCFWFDQGHPGGTQCWSTAMWACEKAEELAKGLDSVEDIQKYYDPLEAEEAEWRAKEKEYWVKNAPYSVKKYKITLDIFDVRSYICCVIRR